MPARTGKSLKNIYSTTLSTNLFTPSSPSSSKVHIKEYLLSLLENLQYVEQLPRYHPEGDALFHSIQVYQCALEDTNDPELLTAALLHDVGKAIDYPNHDNAGADSLANLLSPRIVWLIRHHLDLLISPNKTRRRLAGTSLLKDLEKLRQWDLKGRDPDAIVIHVNEALEHIFQNFVTITHQN